MLIRTGMGGQLSGSVGGVVASRNRGGQYLRNRSVPVNPNSTRQQLARTAFSASSIAWKLLTKTEQGLWTGYANQTPLLNRLGEPITLSGHGMFIRTNAFRRNAGLAITNTAPLTPGLSTLGTVVSITITRVALTYTYSMVTVGNTALGAVIFQMGPSVSNGINYFGGPYTLAAIAGPIVPLSVLTALIATSIAIPIATTTRYGIPQVGEIRGIRVRGIDVAGRLSNSAELLVTVV